MISITRWHEIACGHRVYGHEGKCAHLHGHNYTFEITVRQRADMPSGHSLDALGRVVDFSVVKRVLCEWLEENWDHKTLLWREDPLTDKHDPEMVSVLGDEMDHFVVLPVNPTAENLAMLFGRIGNELLLAADLPLAISRIRLWETAKCSATWEPSQA